MTEFIDKLRQRIDCIQNAEHVTGLYKWLWDNQEEIKDTAETINRQLNLVGEYALKPDLPCLAVGSLSNLVVMAVNPGWVEGLNQMEDAYARRTESDYLRLMANFFSTHPTVVKRCTNWWSRAMSYVELLPGKQDYFTTNNQYRGQRRWSQTQEDQLIGGWELFPWHSSSDGLSRHYAVDNWIGQFFASSIRALTRIKPKLIFVTSIPGYELVRNNILKDFQWTDFEMGQRRTFAVSYAQCGNDTEVLAFRGQLFANMPVDFTRQDFIRRVGEVRTQYLR